MKQEQRGWNAWQITIAVNPVLINDLTAEQQQDIASGLYNLDQLNEYINYMISSKTAYNAK